MNPLVSFCNKVIEYSFYALFFLVPIVFSSATSELFELNKMWLTFAITIIIAAAWIIKSITQKEFKIQKTILDIPILIFLFSQIISTIFSMDRHVSIWGYYSRFNGGLLSIFSYIILYYAFISNLSHLGNLIVKRLIIVSLLSGTIVTLWGLPSHFGYDPTCLLFRGTFDVSCWTDAFQPKVRIFSTLGQPDWLGAYLAILLPLSIVFVLKGLKTETLTDKKYAVSSIKYYVFSKKNILTTLYMLLATLFYVDLLWTKSRACFIAFWISLIFLLASIIISNKKNLSPLIFHLSSIVFLFLTLTFLIGSPLSQLEKFSFSGIKNLISEKKAVKEVKTSAIKIVKEEGGTHSGKIRLIVWEGAINAWRQAPLFGTGVETFAFAYYKHRPQEHNLTSEWDYLYNKAHNEYLNYLTTTGVLGFGSYLAMIGAFLWLVLTKITKSNENHEKDVRDIRKKIRDFSEKNVNRTNNSLVFSLALLSSYLSILVSNFFGFSVVITNIYLFLIPAFYLVLNNKIVGEKQLYIFRLGETKKNATNTTTQNIFTGAVLLFSLYLLYSLYQFRSADKDYALGSNLNKVGQYQEAYGKLHKAVEKRKGEPVFKDEMSANNAMLASAIMQQKDQDSEESAKTAMALAKEAVETSNENIKNYPNNVVFWKTRARIFYALSNIDPDYLKYAVEALEVANKLAPSDAKIAYNLGVLYGQTGDKTKAIEVLINTTKLKQDYRDAFYALGVFYHDLSVNSNEVITKPDYHKKAVEQMNYILNNLSSEDTQAQENLKKWGN